LRRRRRGVFVALIIVCAAVFAVSAYQLLRYYGQYRAAEADFDALRPPDVSDGDAGDGAYEARLPYYKQLYERNADFIGWLQIPGTTVDYPVMQTPDDPQFYLHLNFDKQYQTQGCLFASEISDVLKPTDAVIIYGHKMQTGAMFGNLEKLLEQEAFDTHSEVIFDTLQNRNEYEIYCLFKTVVYTGDPAEFAYYAVADFESEADFDEFLSVVDEKTLIANAAARPSYGDKLIMLSTCEYSRTNGRLVLLAVRTSPAA